MIRNAPSALLDAAGLLLQLAGWLVVVVALASPLCGLFLVSRPEYWVLGDSLAGIVAVLFAAPVVAIPLSLALVHGGTLTRRRSRPRGLCRRCGYDLRAGHEQCPECGLAR